MAQAHTGSNEATTEAIAAAGVGPWFRSVDLPGADLATRVQRVLAPARVIGPGRGRGALLLNAPPVPRVIEVGGFPVVGFAICGRLLDREWRRLGLVELELCPVSASACEARFTWIDRRTPRAGRIGVVDVAIADTADEMERRLTSNERARLIMNAATPVARPLHVA